MQGFFLFDQKGETGTAPSLRSLKLVDFIQARSKVSVFLLTAIVMLEFLLIQLSFEL